MSKAGPRIYVRVPLERVGVLVGEKGEVLRMLERELGVRVVVDSANGTVIIEPAAPGVSPFKLMKAKDFVTAIALGFSPERAERLLSDDQVLVVIDLKEEVGDSPNHLRRVKGRIIGEKGKARKNLEEMTGTYISVYDDKVAIIGDYESAEVARQAIMMLIEGRQHSTVYRYLERELRKLKKHRLTDLWLRDVK